jgi:hypothetical protein
MTVDAAPALDGTIRLKTFTGGETLVGEVLTGMFLAAARTADEDLYLSHFATCPDAQKWRWRQ